MAVACVNHREKILDGEIVFDSSKAGGNPQKLLDLTYQKIHGWKVKIGLREGTNGINRLEGRECGLHPLTRLTPNLMLPGAF